MVVCDATCLERNLNLVLQTMEISSRVLVCVNLLDEAKRKNITINLKKLSQKLGVPVVGTVARSKKSLEHFLEELDALTESTTPFTPYEVKYSPVIEAAIAMAEPAVAREVEGRINSRWLTLKLLEGDPSLLKELTDYLEEDILENSQVAHSLEDSKAYLEENGLYGEQLKDRVVAAW